MALKYRKPNPTPGDTTQQSVRLYVLEATGVNGVDIFSWEQFVANKFHLLYEEMAMRHLHSTSKANDNECGFSDLRNELWLKRLENFIKTHKGKQYRLNPLDLFK